MARFLAGAAIVLGAALLFQVQPMLAKAILPWFGGSAAVWAACVLFFQGVLFLGYAWAHWLNRRVAPRRQGWIQAGLLGLSLLFLPVLPSPAWKPLGTEEPVARILALLAATMGLPYFLLSSTSPLVQAWSARGWAKIPYRYYALSNLASLAALLGYPVVMEPFLSLRAQSTVWSAGYGLFALAFGWLALRAPAAAAVVVHTKPLGPRLPLVWLVLAACASALSLAVTNHLCQNVAPIPFLWVLPLAAYLLSFIVCFERDHWYQRKLFLPLHAAALAGAGYLLLRSKLEFDTRLAVSVLTAGLFVWCVYCHGELARRKPEPQRLTHFYLVVALGGVLGGALVALGAPYLLSSNAELPIALAVCGLLTLLVEYRKSLVTDLAWTGLAIGLAILPMAYLSATRENARLLTRNFYGSLRVTEQGAGGQARRSLIHGLVCHGTQFLAPERRHIPTTYYGAGSGAQLAIEATRAPGQRIGVIGLGVGTVAAYARAGDVYRFYEINPMVETLARREFRFLADSPAAIQVVLGDGRLSLEREPPQGFDVLIVDAFSGDSIPVHLLSRESLALYRRHLKREGLLALHVSNSALDVGRMARAVAQAGGQSVVELRTGPDPHTDRWFSEWLLVADLAETLEKPLLTAAARPPAGPLPGLRPWTDDFSSLLSILK